MNAQGLQGAGSPPQAELKRLAGTTDGSDSAPAVETGMA